jgi:TolB protein
MLLFFVLFLPVNTHSKVYIDIISAPRKIPIAILKLTGPHGSEITEAIKYDLESTGLFEPLPEDAFLEESSKPFNLKNWSSIGAEAVFKGVVSSSEGTVTVAVFLYDAFEGTEMLRKNYKAKDTLIRPLAHTIANDIYRKITGQESAFKSKIAFVKKDPDEHEIYLMDWDGERANGLNITASVVLSPHWSTDGKKLIYSAERKKKWNIYMLDFKKKAEQLLFSSKGTNIAGGFFPRAEDFVLSSSKDGTPDIFIYNIVNSRLIRLTKEHGIEVSPSVSPDGEDIVYVSDRGGTPQIYTMDKNGYNNKRITFSGRYNTSPTWSPTGDMLAFSGNYEGNSQIFLIKPDGNGFKKLTDKGNNEEPTFSPDGRFIAFTSDRDGKKGIYIMRVNGEMQRRITSRDIEASCPRWSPM